MVLVNMEDIQGLLDKYRHKDALLLADHILDKESFDYLYTSAIASFWTKEYERGLSSAMKIMSLPNTPDSTLRWAKNTMDMYLSKIPTTAAFYSGRLFEAALTYSPSPRICVVSNGGNGQDFNSEVEVSCLGILPSEIKRMNLFVARDELWLAVACEGSTIIRKVTSAREISAGGCHVSYRWKNTENMFPLCSDSSIPHNLFVSRIGSVLCISSLEDRDNIPNRSSGSPTTPIFVKIPYNLATGWEIIGTGYIEGYTEHVMSNRGSVYPCFYPDIRVPISYCGAVHLLRLCKSGNSGWEITLLSSQPETKVDGESQHQKQYSLIGREFLMKMQPPYDEVIQMRKVNSVVVAMKPQDYTIYNNRYEYPEGQGDLVLFEKIEDMDAVFSNRASSAEIVSVASDMNQAVLRHKVKVTPLEDSPSDKQDEYVSVLIVSSKYRSLPPEKLKSLIDTASNEYILSTRIMCR